MAKNIKKSTHLSYQGDIDASVRVFKQKHVWITLLPSAVSTLLMITALIKGTTLDVKLIGAAISISVGLFTGKLAETYSIVIREKTFDSKHQELLSKIETSLPIEDMGPSGEIFEAIAASARTAKNVYNTFITLDGGAVYDAYESDVQAMLERFLSKPGNTWHDVITINEVYQFRHLNVAEAKLPGKHRLTVLKHNISILNFIILEFSPPRPTEVFFGWVYDYNGVSSKIFKSSDKRITDMYATYFRSLFSNQQKVVGEAVVEYSKPAEERLRSMDLVDKTGLWCTVAVAPAGRGGKAEPAKALNLAVCQIEFPNSVPQIKGYIVLDELPDRPLMAAEGIAYTKNRMYFEYDEHLPDMPAKRRHCVYHFSWSGRRKVIRGTRYESDDRGRVEIYGVKMSVGPQDKVDIDDPESVKAFARKALPDLKRVANVDLSRFEDGVVSPPSKSWWKSWVGGDSA